MKQLYDKNWVEQETLHISGQTQNYINQVKQVSNKIWVIQTINNKWVQHIQAHHLEQQQRCIHDQLLCILCASNVDNTHYECGTLCCT